MNIIFITLFSLIILFPQKNSAAVKSDSSKVNDKKTFNKSFLDSLQTHLSPYLNNNNYTYEPPPGIDYKIKLFKPDSTIDYKILIYDYKDYKSFLNKLKMNPLPGSLGKHRGKYYPK